jgi:cytochrome c oxidase cbb3-type subunit 3
VKAIAAYIRSILATARGQGAPPPGPRVELKVLVGDAAAGQTFFAARCSSCHSPTGDLSGLAQRVPDPMALQNLWVAGGGGGGRGGGGRGAGAAGGAATAVPNRREVTVTVTLASGQKVEGRLGRIDDFIVTLTQADGTPRSFRRDGDVPRIDIRDPLDGHKKLLLVYTDTDMHNVTAYLATLK